MKILKGYMIMDSIKVDPVYLTNGEESELSPYHTSIVQPFIPDTNVSIKYVPKPKVTVFVPSFYGVQYIAKIDTIKAEVLFEAIITFVDNMTKKEIMSKVVNGVWSGLMASQLYVDQ